MAPKKKPGSEDAVSKAGISTSATGDRVIASSTRADGSVRKEIRVRPGYRPPEDVEVYKNRTAEAYKNVGKGGGGVPGAEAVPDEQDERTGASNKNAKRREARKKAAANTAVKAPPTDAAMAKGEEEKPVAVQDPEAEREKEAKKLAKKLRQAKELKDKQDRGDGLLPEQVEKVIRINELIRQLETLGFGPDGEKKEAGKDAG